MKRGITRFTTEVLQQKLLLPSDTIILGANWNAITQVLELQISHDQLPDISEGLEGNNVWIPVGIDVFTEGYMEKGNAQ